ncbi:helix-turn-helix domain-containing protein [Subtercola sp. Z020]|uniref:helix-turn-helix domain-containing protein n=1 Tax=Subtercola sp. Z020 TaxID=2080582 RepID=UPI001E5FA86A|nr:helix-turn-helix domain-containing protein [Subtercola sp. Z020]
MAARRTPAPRAVAERAHDEVVGGFRSAAFPAATTGAGVRRLVEESWQRSLRSNVDPDRLTPAFDLDDEALREYRSAHPLALVLPVIHRLLIAHTFERGLIVAIGDQAGRLLWIDGDRELRSRAEGMAFVEGANWSERVVGTSAPGTALALDRSIQIGGAEHFNRIVHPWSCSAVPVHDPASGEVLGVIDITGGHDAVSPVTLPLMEAAVAAAEAELRIQQLTPARAHRPERRAAAPGRAASGRPTPAAAPPPRPSPPASAPLLSVLGREVGRLSYAGRTIELSARHSEILTLLAWHRHGLSAEQLAQKLYVADNSVATLRAEMVRLRSVLAELHPALAPLSRPYRMPVPLELDAHRVLAFLERGAHRVALGAYSGEVLAVSTAPGVLEIRRAVSRNVRESLLTDASADVLLGYARTDECASDRGVWLACLERLPTHSPKRASVVSRIEHIDAEFAAERR